MQLNKIDISVIICCYNSENRIVYTLEHLAKQILGSLSCEIILVDNNCSDGTVESAKKTWGSYGIPFDLKVIKENAPGLSFARKCGVFEAKGEIIVFCDDDNWLDEDYFRIAHETMTSNNAIGVLAGQSRAISDVELPTWFYSYYGYFACGVLGLYSGDVTSRLWVWGAGMVVRKEFMEFLYKKYTHTTKDRTKDSMESGGDVEICYWHILEDKILWYDNRLKLQHYMSSDRLNILTAKKQFEAQYKSAEKLKTISKLVSNYYNFSVGKLTLRNILVNLFKLKLRSSITDLYYFMSFTITKSK
jgi:glycosyltransferase involved in cell wall biosynthesis